MEVIREKILQVLTEEFDSWDETKDKVTYFSFKDYIKGEFGFTYNGPRNLFCYHVIDNKKFMWFVLRNKL
jgi:hypothetical protein